FDSFEGLPDPTPEDASVRNPKRGQLMYRLDSVRELIQETVRDPQFVSSRVQFIKGFFQDTLDVMQTRRIALLHLDVDLYASYKSCLDSLYQRVTPGGIITFDEYVRGQIKFPGGVRAIVEFFKDRGLEFERDHYTSNYFVRVPATEYDGPKPASEITRKPLARAGAVETPA
ncbi:MAG: TylF/MycF/NovP-related O-methyltransferase, partial [Planctomycetota bacterium]